MESPDKTEQERAQKFLEEVKKLSEAYGFTFQAQVISEQLGEVVQVRARLVVVGTPKLPGQ